MKKNHNYLTKHKLKKNKRTTKKRNKTKKKYIKGGADDDESNTTNSSKRRLDSNNNDNNKKRYKMDDASNLTSVINKPYKYTIINNGGNEEINGLFTGTMQYNQPYLIGEFKSTESIGGFIGTYNGGWMNGKPDTTGGRSDGIFRFNNGTIYNGQFKDGHLHGKGILELNDGRNYNGNFVNSHMEGVGKMTYPNGDTYAGDFKNSKKDGVGILITNNGLDKYEGAFKKGLRHGKGLLECTVFIYDGDFYRNKITGYGTITIKKTNVKMEGVYTSNQGILVFDGIVTYPDNSKYKGMFYNFEKNPDEGQVIDGDSTSLANESEYDVRFGFDHRDPTGVSFNVDFL
jgi:hypothetical protein